MVASGAIELSCCRRLVRISISNPLVEVWPSEMSVCRVSSSNNLRVHIYLVSYIEVLRQTRII